jgi:class 3 adenylate cyclase
MEVPTWLRNLGLEQYIEVFRANDVDDEVLQHLTAEDLIGLGVISIGHRRKLLEAIAALRDSSAPPTAPPPIPERHHRIGLIGSEAERRHLTVMFADLVGSTKLSARLDPEDMGAVFRAYQECCARVIKRWDGHVAKYMGDGVLAYFGWPRAHEDDAERSVRAGLEVVEAVARLRPNAGATVAARVGIATGLVMVGELIGEGPAQEQTVVGETPNLAARLQALAEPNSVVVSQSTRRGWSATGSSSRTSALSA